MPVSTTTRPSSVSKSTQFTIGKRTSQVRGASSSTSVSFVRVGDPLLRSARTCSARRGARRCRRTRRPPGRDGKRSGFSRISRARVSVPARWATTAPTRPAASSPSSRIDSPVGLRPSQKPARKSAAPAIAAKSHRPTRIRSPWAVPCGCVAPASGQLCLTRASAYARRARRVECAGRAFCHGRATPTASALTQESAPCPRDPRKTASTSRPARSVKRCADSRFMSKAAGSTRSAPTTRTSGARATSARRAPPSAICTTIRTACARRSSVATGSSWKPPGKRPSPRPSGCCGP